MNPLLRPPPGRRDRAVLVVRALVALASVERAVRSSPLSVLCSRAGIRFLGFDAPPREAALPRPLPMSVMHRWWALEQVLRVWPWGRGRSCLRRSLSLGALVRELHPGLSLEVTALVPFRAHAWLLVAGHRLDLAETDEVLHP